MTGNDDFIPRLEAYLEEYEGVTPLPDAVRDAVRAELPKTKQARLLGRWARFTTMSNPIRIGLAAAVLAIAAFAGYNLLGNRNTGTPTSTPTPTAAPSTAAGLPVELQHTYFGPWRELPGDSSGSMAALIITATELQFHTDAGQAFIAHASLAAPGQLRLTSTAGIGCQPTDEGVYPYTMSAGGSVFTIGPGTDDCAARGAAMPGEWFTAQCKTPAPNNECLGNLDPGTYASHYFEPVNPELWPRFGALWYTVPAGWANYGDGLDGFGLTPQSEYAAFDGGECYDCDGTRDTVRLLADPGAAAEDCSDANVPGIGHTADELLAWLSGHPGLIVSGVDERGLVSVSFRLEVAADWTGTCDDANPVVAVPLFYKADAYLWALEAGDAYQVVLIDLSGGQTVAVIVDTANVDDIDAFAAETATIIDEFGFTEP